MSQVTSHQDNNNVHNSGSVGSSAPVKNGNKGVGDAPFNPDDAVNAAINLQVGMIEDMADITLSMSDMNATIQKNGVSNSESAVEMWRALLSAQGMCSNGDWFKKVVQQWASHVSKNPGDDNAAGFQKFLQGLGGGYYAGMFEKVMDNPNMTQADKDMFAQQVGNWSNECNGHLSSFLNKGSVIAQQLNMASTNVQNWQSIADAMKPTQIQQAETELIAEIGSETSMWGDVVSA